MGNPFIVAEDLAIKTLLGGMTVSDEKNAARQVKIWFGYPDVEVRTQDFPFITIDLIDIVPANDRQTQGRFSDTDNRGTQTPVADYVFTYDVPVAYDLVYQIMSHARHPRHDRAIMLQLMRKFPSKFGYLVVPNELGTESSRRHMFLDGFTKRDTADSETGNRRLLRNVLTIRVISEMSAEQATAKIVASTVSVNTTNSNIPSTYNPVQ
jgi:hypothetical protein